MSDLRFDAFGHIFESKNYQNILQLFGNLCAKKFL